MFYLQHIPSLFVFYPVVAWLLLGLSFLFAEMLTPGLFFFISFAGGAVFAALGASIGMTFEVQVASWLIGSGVTFKYLCHLLQKKRLSSVESKDAASNTSALVGLTVRVIDAIPAGGVGRVKADREIWSAIVHDGLPLSKDATAQVLRVEGNKLVVQKH